MAQTPEQLVLELPFRQALGRDDFFVSRANEQAVVMIDKWPDWPNPILVLSGPPGSGKSHLGQVWCQASNAKKISALDMQIENLPALLSDGALLVSIKPEDQLDETALFHLINLTREQGAFLMLIAQMPPAMWNIQLPDLASRLAAAGSVALQEPDDDLLRAILIKQFADRQIQVDEPTISFMVSRMERSARSARELVAKIDHEALRQKANVTRPFVSGILKQQLNLLENQDLNHR